MYPRGVFGLARPFLLSLVLGLVIGIERERSLASRAPHLPLGGLVQAETLYAMLKPEAFPAADFENAWNSVLLYSEHTWGAWCSVSGPERKETLEQWAIKQSYALDADKQSRALLKRILDARPESSRNSGAVEVFNTTSWPRSEIVTLTAELSRAGDRVTDARGRAVPSQRLATRELAFLAWEVPPFGSALFQVSAGDPGALKVDLAEAGGAVLHLNRMAEERDAKTWAAPVIVSTNVSLQSKLVSSGIDTDAQMARLLEVSIQSHQLFKSSSNAGQKIHSHVTTNYGYAGRKYISELVRIGEAGLVQMIEDARKNFVSKYGVSFAGEERYWEQAIILQDLGSEIAQRLGLIKYDYTLGTKWVLNQIGSIRHSIRDNKQDAFDILGEYLNDNASAAVTVMQTCPSGRGLTGSGKP